MTPEAKIFDRSKIRNTAPSVYKYKYSQETAENTTPQRYDDENPIPDKANKQDEARRERKADWLRKERSPCTGSSGMEDRVEELKLLPDLTLFRFQTRERALHDNDKRANKRWSIIDG
ncbi:hypothetical protein BCON_0014g00590 [Botryotinia convoluta]|uniref:Uncharacterized protein n=1 Tax=Botryotinia convoluta TaxID=54673 RepID=A0A4Z1IV88_9HELO|nr:hypothetical protein BCON_0014g00590 [Botryotinia convoluta]